MSRAEAHLLLVFREAWGRSLPELAQAEATPFSPSVELGSLTDAALPNAEEAHSALFDALLRLLWSRNQFVELDEATHAELAASLHAALGAIARGRPLLESVAVHRRELSAVVRRVYGDPPREVVCAEYSPELQLAVLGLGPEQLRRGPVLDVGCGSSAALVRELRARGVVAFGLDRSAPSELGMAGDWLTFDYGVGRFRCVLSHLGFTLHFLHHHFAEGDAAYGYARAYMAILRSLSPGGLFAYTPGLPFLEQLLDRRAYRVHRVDFSDELRVPTLENLERASGLSLGYSIHVERLAG